MNQEIHGGPLKRVLDLFSNVWFGVVLAALLFIYCSVGSAVPVVRQLPALEMTEFEWFHWWPFNLLIALFCVTLATVTIRRIPLRQVNAGVWMIHTGIITLVLGSYYYFGTKVEGDAPVFRRQVRIELPGMVQPETLPVLPGAKVRVAAGPDAWDFEIQNTSSAWPILSDEHKGETAYAVNVSVTPPKGAPFVRQLLAGFEQYTEDVIPGQGRAVKSTGKKLVDENLKLTLDYEPQTYFHVMDTWALFVRRAGDADWVERPIKDLPRYHDRIGTRDLVFSEPYAPPELRAIDLLVPPSASSEPDPLGSAAVRITGYLRYAQMQRRWREGGDRLNPVLGISVLPMSEREQSYELVAMDPAHSRLEDGLVQFVWLGAASEVDALPTDSRPLLHIAVPSAEVAMDVPITQEKIVGREGPFTPIEKSDFSYRILAVQNNLSLPGQARPVSIAMVEIQSPEEVFRRWVSDQPRFTRDIHGEGVDPHALDAQEADPRIQMTYQPQSAPLIFAGYPGGLHLVFNGPQGRALSRTAKPGDVVEVVPGLSVRVDSLWSNAVAEVKPYVVPAARRDRDARESFSMIRLEVDSGRGVESRWVPYNHYVFPNDQYAYAGRFTYSPERFRLADGSVIELMFSRERRALPHAIALEEFELDTHLGGYTGATSTIRNYVSKLRFQEGERWTEPTAIAVNSPAEYGGYWYFQSMWDRPASGDPGGGMNYTGLGVGNRHGVYVQLAGCCIAVAGMIFAFYVKPVIKRRRAEQSRAGRMRTDDEAESEFAADAARETIRV